MNKALLLITLVATVAAVQAWQQGYQGKGESSFKKHHHGTMTGEYGREMGEEREGRSGEYGTMHSGSKI